MMGALIIHTGCLTVPAALDEADSTSGAPDGAPTAAHDAAPTGADAQPVAPCSEGDERLETPGGTCYALFLSTLPWSDAAEACGALDAHLVAISSGDEQATVASLVAARQAWIGLADLAGAFAWTSDEPVTYTLWQPDQPDNGGGGGDSEDCAKLIGADGGRWNDEQCDRLQAYVCER